MGSEQHKLDQQIKILYKTIEFSELAYLQLKSNDQYEWIEKLDVEYPNLRNTIGWCLDNFKTDPNNNQFYLETVFNITYFLTDYLCWRGSARECLDWLEAAFASAEDVVLAPLLNAKALYSTGMKNVIIFELWH